MHAPISDQECAGDAIRRHIGQRRCDGGEQFGAVSLAIRLTGLDHAHFKPFDVPQPGHQRFARLLRFAGAFAEILAWAFIDDDSDDRRERLAFLACEGRIGQRKQDQRERCYAHGCAA